MMSCRILGPAGARAGAAGLPAGALYQPLRVSQAKVQQRCQSFMSNTQTSNPAFRYANFSESMQAAPEYKVGSMTMNGALGKTAILLLVAMAGAGYTWNMFFAGMATAKSHAALVAVSSTMQQTAVRSSIAALVLSIATVMKPHWADKTAVLCAIFKGAALGSISAVLEFRYPGLVMSTVALTMGVAGSLLAAYKSGMIQVSDRFRSVVTVAVMGVVLTYGGMFVARMLGAPLLFMTSGLTGMGIAAVTSMIAASTLLLDFDNIQRLEYSAAPRWMEWYSGFSVLVSLLWLYFELLRLGSMFMGRGQSE